MDRQIKSVKPPPDDEGPVRSVPKTAEEHRYHIIQIRSRRPVVAAAERNIKVIAQPARKGNMPSTPEFRDIRRKIGLSEVQTQLDSEQSAHAAGDVGVTGKVTVNLQREKIHSA